MKFRAKRSMLAGIMSLAVMAQALPAMQLPAALHAAAAVSVDTIQTRVFQYDFGSFKALYDTRTSRWFDEKGRTLVKPDGAEQTVSVPEKTFGENVSALVLNPFDGSFAVGMQDGSVTYPDGILSAETVSELTQMLAEIGAVKPEYRTSYYDRAQQKNIDVPAPDGFPLIYKFTDAALENAHLSMSCRIYFGTILYGTVTAKDGRTTFARISESDEGAANPFTSAGDASVDGVQDVSDAVLTSRLLAEDKKTPVTALGADLADKNEDGMLTGRDVTEILFDIVRTPVSKRGPVSPAGTLPVVSLEQSCTAPDDALAQRFGYAEAAALNNAVREENGAAFRAFTHCQENSQNDVWDILYYDKGGCGWHQFNVRSLTLESDGTLAFAADYFADQTAAEAAVPWVHLTLTVPHGDLPKNLRTAWNLTEVRAAEPDAQAITSIAVEKLPANAVPVLRLVQSADDEDAMAKAVGFQDAAALEAEIKMMNVNVHEYQKCTEGTEYDTWNFVYIIEGSGRWQQDTVRSLQLMPNGRFDLEVEAVDSGASASESRSFSWVQLTVPHGTLPLNRGSKLGYLDLSWQLTQSDAPSGVKPVRYLTVSDLPENAIPVLHVQTTPLRIADLPEAYARYGMEFDNQKWMDGQNYPDSQLKKTESKAENGYTYDTYSCLLTMLPYDGGFNQMELKSISLFPDHSLHLETEYTFDKYHYTPGITENYFAMELRFSVPHGSLPDKLWITSWSADEHTNCRRFELPEVQYITCASQESYPFSDVVIADVRIDSDHTGDVIPAEFRERLAAHEMKFAWQYTQSGGYEYGSFETDPDAEYEWRFYREPDETDDADIQLLLSKGKDVAALYYVRDAEDQGVVVSNASLFDGELEIQVDGSYCGDEERKQTFYRVLLVAPDGLLPDVLDYVPEFMISEEPKEYFETYPVDESELEDYVYIKLKETYGIRTKVQVLDPFADGSEPTAPEDVVSELAAQPEGSFVFRQYTDAADTDNSVIQDLIGKGKDVLAVYTASADQKVGTVGAMLGKNGVLDLNVIRQAAEPAGDVKGIWGLLLVTDHGDLPEIQTVNVRDAGAYTADDFIGNAVSVFRIQDCRENFARTEVRTDTVSAFPAEADLYFNETGKIDFAEIITDPSYTNDPDIRELLAEGHEAVIAVYIRDTNANHQYAVTQVDRCGYYGVSEEMRIYYAYFKPENVPAKTCAGHRILLIPEAGKRDLRFYTEYDAEMDNCFCGDFSKSVFESNVKNPVYIPYNNPEETVTVPDAVEIIATPELTVEETEYLEDFSGAVVYSTDAQKERLKKIYGIEADWSGKLVAEVTVNSRLEGFRCGIGGVAVDAWGGLDVTVVQYTTEPKTNYHNPTDEDYFTRPLRRQVFLLVIDQDALPAISYAICYDKMFNGSQIYQFEDEISRTPVLAVNAQQIVNIQCSAPGTCVRHTTDLLTDLNGRLLNDGEPVYKILSADAAQNAEFLSLENTAAQLTFPHDEVPDLNGADMLLVGFAMNGNVTKCSATEASIDKDGILHMSLVVFRDKTQTDLNDMNAACVLGIAAESGTFADINGVVFDEVREYEGDPDDQTAANVLNPFGSAYREYEAWAELSDNGIMISRYDTEPAEE